MSQPAHDYGSGAAPPVGAPYSPGHPGPPGYYPPYGYPMQYRGPRPPGAATSVLMFIQAGVVLITTVWAQIFTAWIGGTSSRSTAATVAAETGLVGIVQFASVALLITGGVLVRGGKARVLAIAANVVQLILSTYWIVWTGTRLMGFSEAASLLYPAAVALGVLPLIAVIRLAGRSPGIPNGGVASNAYVPPSRSPTRYVTAAAVLMFIQAGIVGFLAFLFLVAAASASGGFNVPSTELVVLAAGQLVSAIFLVVAGVRLRTGAGRIGAIVANIGQLALIPAWMIVKAVPSEGTEVAGDGASVASGAVLLLFFVVLPCLALAFTANREVASYIRARANPG